MQNKINYSSDLSIIGYGLLQFEQSLGICKWTDFEHKMYMLHVHVGRPAHRLKNEKGTPSCDTNEISISPQFKPHTKELLHNAANCLHTLRSNDHTPEKVSSLLLVLPS